MLMVYVRTGVTSFDIVTNCGLDSHKLDQGESVVNFMLAEKKFSAKEMHKNTVEFEIDRLICSPECLSGVLTAPFDISKEDIIAIDIGTKNFQLIQMIEGVPLYDKSYATKFGMHHMYEGMGDVLKVIDKRLGASHSVKMYLQKTAKYHLELTQLKSNRARLTSKKQSTAVIDKKISDLVSQSPIIEKIDKAILEYLMESIFPEIDSKINAMEMGMYTRFVFLGGGSDYLRRFLEIKYINKENPVTFIKRPFYANVKGMYNRAVNILGKPITVQELNDSTKEMEMSENNEC
ncbi:MAG: hypothetical protein ACRCX2_22520, partial [Paraclostridium sp.]